MNSGLYKNPTFSVIIPTFNSAKTINVALKSVLQQNFTNFEILIIDGASTDTTLSIAKEFNDKRVKIYTEKDKGVYDAMNKGIKLASGEWLYFLGSDDELYDPEVLNDIFIKTNSKGNRFGKRDTVLYGNVLILGDTGWGRKGQVYDGEFSLEKLLKNNISHQAIFYHRKVFRQCGNYNLKYRICADYDFNLRVASKFKLKYVNRIVAKFNADGVSTNVQDVIFNDEFSKNVIHYYFYQLHNNAFNKYERDMLIEGRTNLKKFHLFKGIYFLSIAMYYRSKRNLKN